MSFSLSQLSDGIPFFSSEFSCDVTRGELAPGGSLRAMVTYTPAVADAVSVEYLSLKYRGALSKSLLKLTGKCIGKVQIKLYKKSIIISYRYVFKILSLY